MDVVNQAQLITNESLASPTYETTIRRSSR
jgi:hypothetical protein